MFHNSHSSRRSVASGTFVISPKKDEILEANLGTCVGVTLCDPEAGLGGLIHLLLPEPLNSGKGWHPASYASTGLPLFIQGLITAGAKKERLKACVAGGALVGPLSERDLKLDLGGRTFEIVEDLLNKEGIPIIETETGGFFTCRLSLDLSTLESGISPMKPHTASMLPPQPMPTCERIEDSLERVRPIPQVALKIIRMLQDTRHSMSDISREIRRDQVIAAKLIRVCHSAFFGSKMGIDSIDRALVLLGEKRFLMLVVSTALMDFYPETCGGYSLCRGGLYRHALGAAVLSEKLADFTGTVGPDIAYTAGLLHDIGKVVLDQYLAEDFSLFYRRTQEEGTELIEVEKEEIGVTHTEIGGILAERWSLPDNLTDAIRHHHRPENAATDPELTHIVYLADLLMSRFVVGHDLERIDTRNLTSTLAAVGLKDEHFPAIVDRIPQEVFAPEETLLPAC